MPIRIPNTLPAAKILESENIFVMDTVRASKQDIRPLKILVLNLMPTKIATETQLARLLGNTAIQVDLELIAMNRTPKNTSKEHMAAFYKTFSDVKNRYFDGFIITGAPIETLPFEEVDYWAELCEIMEWSKSHVQSTFHICWGAQAGLYYHYGIPKYPLPEKMFGVYEHRVVRKHSILFRGFDDVFWAPHSRHTTIRKEDILKVPKLKLLAESDEAGVFAVSTDGGRQVFITGHAEYDATTLRDEYRRDCEAGLNIHVPAHYFPDDNDRYEPVCRWRSTANLLYANWLNYFVYQETPYSLSHLFRGSL